MLGIPTVMDRVIQQAIAQVLTPLFDPAFSPSSHGFRPGRSAHDALRQVKRYVLAGRAIAVDLDLAKFFDKVNHDVLMARVARKVRDKTLLALIDRYLRAGVYINGIKHPTTIGTYHAIRNSIDRRNARKPGPEGQALTSPQRGSVCNQISHGILE